MNSLFTGSTTTDLIECTVEDHTIHNTGCCSGDHPAASSSEPTTSFEP